MSWSMVLPLGQPSSVDYAQGVDQQCGTAHLTKPVSRAKTDRTSSFRENPRFIRLLACVSGCNLRITYSYDVEICLQRQVSPEPNKSGQTSSSTGTSRCLLRASP